MLGLLQSMYNAAGINVVASEGDLWGLLGSLFILISSLPFLLAKKSATPTEEIKEPSSEQVIPEQAPAPVTEVKVVTWKERLKSGLSRSRSEIWGKVTKIFHGKIDDEKIEEIEELLYGADVGPTTVNELLAEIEKNFLGKEANEEEFKKFLFDFLKSKMHSTQESVDHSLYEFSPESNQLKVIMVVGVNGAGKTTTIGKLATKLTGQGAKVVVGACDTFRAAAVDQLEVWCNRAGAEMIRAKEGSNPSGVGFQALEKAIQDKADYCILDTAGRLHTAGNLMEELLKSKKVLGKLDPEAPHHVLLVLDAITGQNAIRQAEEFHKTLNLTGLIFTKCDGSSKAGSAISIVEKLKTPIAYIGVGENVEDLNVFNLDEYLGALLGIEIKDA